MASSSVPSADLFHLLDAVHPDHPMGAVGAFATSLNKPELHKPSGQIIGARAFEHVFQNLPYIDELVKGEVGEYVRRLEAALSLPTVSPDHQAAMRDLAAQLQRASDDAEKARNEAEQMRTKVVASSADVTRLARKLEKLRRKAGDAAAAAESASFSAQSAESNPSQAAVSNASAAADAAADKARDVANLASSAETSAESAASSAQDASMDASQLAAAAAQAEHEISAVRNDMVILNWKEHMAPVVVGVGAYGDFTGSAVTIDDAPDGQTPQGFTQNNAIAKIITFAERRTEANPTVLWYKELAVMWNAFDEKLVKTKPSPVAKTDWAKYNERRPKQKGGEFERLASLAVYIDYVATFADVNSVDANDLVPPDRIVGGEDVDEFLGGLEKLTTTETDIVMG